MKKLLGIILLIGLVTGVGWAWKKFGEPMLAQRQVLATTDSKEGKPFRIGGDSYIGYWFLKCKDFTRRVANKGLRVTVSNDEGAYADRLEKFNRKEYEAIVLPVSSYLDHGLKYGYPGSIVIPLAESNGADVIVAFKDKVPHGTVQDLDNPGLVWVMVGDSPSEFLTDITKSDVNLPGLSGSTWKRTVGSMKEVLAAIKARQGDVFVLWEPDASIALKNNPNLVRVWGSERYKKYIVDVLVVHSDVIKNRSEDVRLLLEAYYLVRKTYEIDQKKLVSDMMASEDLSEDLVKGMLARVHFFDLQETARDMFGITDGNGAAGSEGVIDTIMACTSVLIKSGKLKADPTAGEPDRLTYKRFVQDLAKSLPAVLGRIQPTTFEQLDDDGWRKLPEVFSLRTDDVTFKPGESLLDDHGKEVVLEIAARLKNNYPAYRVIVRGHTNQMASEEESKTLSQERAEVVLKYLTVVGGINPDRLRAEGMGALQPPARLPDESDRAFAKRRSRVGIVFVEGGKL